MLGKNQNAIAKENLVISNNMFVFLYTSAIINIVVKFADVAELVDALDLGSSVFGREGSSPFIRIKYSCWGYWRFIVIPKSKTLKPKLF